MNGSLGTGTSLGSSKSAHNAFKHRRLSSSGQSKRRYSDVREATSRPTPAALQTAVSALTSLATLSLSTSPPPARWMTLPDEELLEQISDKAEAKLDEMGVSVSTTKTGKKRATIFKCESCSKVYRHPSCLIKHRWEHSPHWREASKFLLSKHQQVQLLEAAAILSHLSPTASGGTSLPEDRALWPSYLSGGTLPLPSVSNSTTVLPTNGSFVTPSHPTSSSAPSSSIISHSSSSGPRMHDYAIPDSASVAHLRPGVVGIPTDPMTFYPAVTFRTETLPVPVPTIKDVANGRSISLGGASSTLYSTHSGGSYAYSDEGIGGWSLPNSSVRSGSSSPPTDDEDDHEFIAMDESYSFSSREFDESIIDRTDGKFNAKAPEEVWDGMDMDMDL